MTWDVITCIGPADESLLPVLLPSIQENIAPRRIYVITSERIIGHYLNQSSTIVYWINETLFPFQLQDIHKQFNHPQRSGWYLQQLLKLYAPLLLADVSEKFIYIDADVRIHRPLRFFQDGKILFNAGMECHSPYFRHMERLVGLSKKSPVSGICHLMPMTYKILRQFHEDVERRHGIPLWMAFLAMVDPVEYGVSGASEYELLFTYALTFYPEETSIRPVLWQNTSSATPNTLFDYEAWHGYMRE